MRLLNSMSRRGIKVGLPLALAGTLGCVVHSGAQVDFSFKLSVFEWLSLLDYVVDSTPPISAEETPVSGTFYSAQFGKYMPPLPANILGLPFWSLGDGVYLVDDRCVNYDLTNEETTESTHSGGSRSVALPVNNALFDDYGVYGKTPYMTNVSATLRSNSTVLQFDIAGGERNVPYDVLRGTDLESVGSNTVVNLTDWDWVGIGYRDAHYAFTNLSIDHDALYALATPTQTRVFGWGNNEVGQCDVPANITNAVMICGGGGQSLALLDNGTVRAWGQNSSGQGSAPSGLSGVAMIASGWYHNLALLTNGTVVAWGNYTNVPTDLKDVKYISANSHYSLALKTNMTVTAWGWALNGETNIPSGLSGVVAISAGVSHVLAATTNGTVTAWGNNSYGKCYVPTNIQDVVDVAAGIHHSLALLENGTVVAWGGNNYGECNVPPGLSNVVAIATGGNPLNTTNSSPWSMALCKDGTVMKWGSGSVVENSDSFDHVIAIAGIGAHALALRTGPSTPVCIVTPAVQHTITGGSATFSCEATGFGRSLNYQWKHNGVNISGATNATLTLSNLQASQSHTYSVQVTSSIGSSLSSDSKLHIITPPIITSRTLPTDPIISLGQLLSLSVTAEAPSTNLFPINYYWLKEGNALYPLTSNIFCSCTVTGNFSNPKGYSVIVSNAAGTTSANWSVSTTSEGTYADEGTLAYHFATNALAHASGKSLANNGLLLNNWPSGTVINYPTNLGYLSSLTWSTNCWLSGVQGLSATSIATESRESGQALVTMISPIHFIRASHTSLSVHPGYSNIAFLSSENQLYWRSVCEQNRIANTDITVGILNSELPTSVGYLPILPNNYLNYLPTGGTHIIQLIGMNQYMRVFSQPSWFDSQTSIYWDHSLEVPLGLSSEWNIKLITGDSSAPERFLINNHFFLISLNQGVPAGQNIIFYKNQINEIMTSLSEKYNKNNYQITQIPLIEFNQLN